VCVCVSGTDVDDVVMLYLSWCVCVCVCVSGTDVDDVVMLY